MTPDTRSPDSDRHRTPTDTETEVAAHVLPPSDGADFFILGALRTELAKALELTPGEEQVIADLDPDVRQGVFHELHELYVHMSNFDAAPCGAVSSELRRRIAALSAGV